MEADQPVRPQYSQFQRDLIKSPRYFGTKYDIKPHIRRFMQPGEYKLTSVPNTIISCTGCQGNGYILQKHTDRLGIITMETCPICNGTKQISNKQEAGA